MPTLKIKYKDKTILEELHKAEKHLTNAGVTFDKAHNLQENIREWSLGWSLNGAELTYTDKEKKEIYEKN